MDIRATAVAYLRRHGDRAAIHAGMKADAAADRGDLDTARQWQRVMALIHAMTTSPTDRTQ